ncbi:MAG: ASCH domain-containing protein [Deltaproteobacteria bacterium]|nr:ASCH domain-containing protein [Deltaproteobacteria bacterium]
MLLFKKPFWDGLTSGAITLTYRRWDKPHVRAGGRYRCHPIGVIEVDAIERVEARAITAADAARAGFGSVDELRAYLAELGPLDDASPLWRVEMHHGGDGDRVEIALDTALTSDDVATIRAKLARMDAEQPWTARTLELIGQQPRIAASKLAPHLGRETLDFKANVRKLKHLGLTQSFEVGYEVSPRGRAYLDAVATLPPAPPKAARPAKAKSPKKAKKVTPAKKTKRAAKTKTATKAKTAR